MPHSADSSSSSEVRSDELSTRSTSVSSASQTGFPHTPHNHHTALHSHQPSLDTPYEILTAREITLPYRSDSAEAISPGITGFRFDNFGAGAPIQSSIPSPTADKYHFPAASPPRQPAMNEPGVEGTDEVDNRRRSRWYDDQFSYKTDHPSLGRETVCKEAPVLAELRTNVIVKDEYTLVTDLSRHMAERYNRAETSVLVTVTHSACLMYGGTFDPAYVLTVTALPEFVQPTVNKRNAALTQTFMADVLGVVQERGVVKFEAIREENIAVSGRTVQAQIDSVDEVAGLRRQSTTRSIRKSLIEGKRKSWLGAARKASIEQMPGLTRKSSSTSLKNGLLQNGVEPAGTSISPPLPNSHTVTTSTTSAKPPAIKSREHSKDSVVRLVNSKSNGTTPTNGFGLILDTDLHHAASYHTNGNATVGHDHTANHRPNTSATARISPTHYEKPAQQRPQSARKSILKMTNTFDSNGSFFTPVPPPVPIDEPTTPKVGKRKSLIAMFRR